MISQRTRGDSPCDKCKGSALISPGTRLCGGCPQLLLGGSGAGNVSWFGSDKDPPAQVPEAHRWNTRGGSVFGWLSLNPSISCFFPSSLGPSLWFNLRPSGCILNHPHSCSPQPAFSSLCIVLFLYRHERERGAWKEQTIRMKFQASPRFLVAYCMLNLSLQSRQ